MPEDQNKPRFEPPPWEREAFDRFQQERARTRAAEELDEAMRGIRQTPTPENQAAPDTQGTSAATEAATALAAPEAPEPKTPSLPESRIDAMLIQLRAEEIPAPPPNMVLIDSASALLAITGLVIIIQSARLFAGAQTGDAAGTLLAATLSFVILMTGVGFLAGATLLFRKYHR